MKIIPRPIYTDKIIQFLNKGLIIALTGQRRVGKSYILRDLSHIIKETNPSANVVFINKERKEYNHIRTDEDLDAYLKDKIV